MNFSSPDFLKFSASTDNDVFRNWQLSMNFNPRYVNVENCSRFVAMQLIFFQSIQENVRGLISSRILLNCGKRLEFQILLAYSSLLV